MSLEYSGQIKNRCVSGNRSGKCRLGRHTTFFKFYFFFLKKKYNFMHLEMHKIIFFPENLKKNMFRRLGYPKQFNTGISFIWPHNICIGSETIILIILKYPFLHVSGSQNTPLLDFFSGPGSVCICN